LLGVSPQNNLQEKLFPAARHVFGNILGKKHLTTARCFSQKHSWGEMLGNHQASFLETIHGKNT